MKYTLYRREDYEAIVRAYRNHEDMLVVRRCVVCGDDLLGTVEAENSTDFVAQCESGHCASRPGIHYSTGDTIEL